MIGEPITAGLTVEYLYEEMQKENWKERKRQARLRELQKKAQKEKEEKTEMTCIRSSIVSLPLV